MLKNKENYRKYVERELNRSIEVGDASTNKYVFKNKSLSQLISSVKQTTWKNTYDNYLDYKQIVEIQPENNKVYMVPKTAKQDIVRYFNAEKELIDNVRIGLVNSTYKRDKVAIIYGNSDLILLVDFENKGIKYCVETWLKNVDTKKFNEFDKVLKSGAIYYSANNQVSGYGVDPNEKLFWNESIKTPSTKNEIGQRKTKALQEGMAKYRKDVMKNLTGGIYDMNEHSGMNEEFSGYIVNLVETHEIKGVKFSWKRGINYSKAFERIIKKFNVKRCDIKGENMFLYF